MKTIFANHADQLETDQKGAELLNTVRDDLASLPDEVKLEFWVSVACELARLAPNELDEILQILQELMPRPMSAYDKRALEILSARIRAFACHTQGKFDEAIEYGMSGFSCLDGHYGMPPSGDGRLALLVWLEQAGDIDQMVKVLETLMYDGAVADELRSDLLLKIWQMMDSGIQHPMLALFIGEYVGENAEFDVSPEVLRLRDVDGIHLDDVAWGRRYITLARDWAGDDSYYTGRIDLYEADYLIETTELEQQDDAYHRHVLALLERGAVNAKDSFAAIHVFNLWKYRLCVHGKLAFEMPFVSAGNAAWSYNAGNNFNEDVAYDGELDEFGVERDELVSLIARYYADGIARYEYFWMTGDGAWRDGWSHIYAMMCHNYVLILDEQGCYDEMVEVAKKGIAISPFAYLYEDVCNGTRELKDYAGYLEAQENLWQFNELYGYDEYVLAGEMSFILESLDNLGRDGEIVLWIERLEHWWENLDEDSQECELSAYYEHLTLAISELSKSKPVDARVRLEPHLDMLDQLAKRAYSNDSNALAYAGLIFHNNGQYQEAVDWYDKALLTADDEYNLCLFNEWRQDSLAMLGDHKNTNTDTLSGTADSTRQKPWWKLW